MCNLILKIQRTEYFYRYSKCGKLCHLTEIFYNICFSHLQILILQSYGNWHRALWYRIKYYWRMSLVDLLTCNTNYIFFKRFPYVSYLLTTCFGLYAPHQVLNLYVGNCYDSSVSIQVFFPLYFRMRSLLCASVSHSDGPLSLCVAFVVT